MENRFMRVEEVAQELDVSVSYAYKVIRMCMVLPSVIEKAVKDLDGTLVPHDTVIDELKEMAAKRNIESEDLSIAMAAYMLGFGSYKGFAK